MSEAASTKADDVALELEQAIVSGELAPGTVLRQEQLSARYGVSRTPIREALRRVAALGLVSFEPNRGVRVRTLTRAELREAFLIRAELESLATEIAAERMTRADLDELEAIEDRFAGLTDELRRGGRLAADRRAGLVTEWVRANHAFHDVIYRVAGSADGRADREGRPLLGLCGLGSFGRRRARRALRRERAAAPGAPRRIGGRQLERRPSARARARALLRRVARTDPGSATWIR